MQPLSYEQNGLLPHDAASQIVDSIRTQLTEGKKAVVDLSFAVRLLTTFRNVARIRDELTRPESPESAQGGKKQQNWDEYGGYVGWLEQVADANMGKG
jgi:hypothetical protein